MQNIRFWNKNEEWLMGQIVFTEVGRVELQSFQRWRMKICVAKRVELIQTQNKIELWSEFESVV